MYALDTHITSKFQFQKVLEKGILLDYRNKVA